MDKTIEPKSTHPRRKTMTPAALEANRRNARAPGSGRRMGVMNGERVSFKERCRRNDYEWIEVLEHIARTDPNNGFRMTAIRDLWDRGHGRPTQQVEGTGPGGAIPFQVVLPAALCDEDES